MKLKFGIPLLALFLCLVNIPLQAQESEQTTTSRQIRVRKLAQNWKGERVELKLADQSLERGVLLDADFSNFTINRNSRKVKVPINNVVSVTLPPGPMELSLVIASGALGGGFLAGIISLTAQDATNETIASAGLLGIAGGFWWGYTTFYQEEVIELE